MKKVDKHARLQKAHDSALMITETDLLPDCIIRGPTVQVTLMYIPLLEGIFPVDPLSKP